MDLKYNLSTCSLLVASTNIGGSHVLRILVGCLISYCSDRHLCYLLIGNKELHSLERGVPRETHGA